MSDEPVPIRPGVLPEFDAEREFVDYLAGRVRMFVEANGCAPDAVALVLLSATGKGDVAHSWTPNDNQLRYVTCSRASVLLVKRALSGV